MAGTGHSVEFSVAASGGAVVDALMSGSTWLDATITYSFPTTGGDYVDYATSEPDGIVGLSAKMKTAARFALDRDDGNAANDGFSLEGFSDVTVTFVTTDAAHLRVAQTTENPFGYDTAWGGNPWWNPEAGDVWFHTEVFDYTAPEPGAHEWRTHLHEIGHALGLKHGHADEGTGYGVLPAAMDGFEYSLMTYRNHPGSGIGIPYGTDSAPQTYMMADIAALQYLYGADFDTNSGNTTYRWTPGSSRTWVDGAVAIDPDGGRIFATIWDGGGTDTYDLGAYATDLMLDLRPGKHSLFSSAQAADLGGGVSAKGNIYNALQYEGDKRSLIENARGGSGDDTITGNAGRNALFGNNGKDVLDGLAGKDKLAGGGGGDILKGGGGNDRLLGAAGGDRLDGGGGRDSLTGGKGGDVFVFARGYGKDVVRYFQDDIDTIRLNDNLWGGAGFGKQKVIDTFASVVNGDVVFDFGKKGMLTLDGFSDLAELKDDLILV